MQIGTAEFEGVFPYKLHTLENRPVSFHRLEDRQSFFPKHFSSFSILEECEHIKHINDVHCFSNLGRTSYFLAIAKSSCNLLRYVVVLLIRSKLLSRGVSFTCCHLKLYNQVHKEFLIMKFVI